MGSWKTRIAKKYEMRLFGMTGGSELNEAGGISDNDGTFGCSALHLWFSTGAKEEVIIFDNAAAEPKR